MTEQEWLGCHDARRMLQFLRGRVSNRKMRLFTVGWCRRRRIEEELPDQRSWDAVHVAEWVADGNGTERDLEAARKDAEASAVEGFLAAVFATAADAWDAAFGVVRMMREQPCPWWQGDDWWEEVCGQVAILREILGPLPFRPITLEPSWLAWDDGCIVKLAKGTYEERTFESLPILADALEEAGCTNGDILAHLRGPGPHVRGCWVIDLLLGKQ
jgi:hypothetical protein